MNQPSPIIVKPNALDATTLWTFAALFSHTMWGAYPVFARYLQTISLVPSMALNVLANILATLVFLVVFRQRIVLSVFRRKSLWVFAMIVILRAITNLLAARYTLALYVQIITIICLQSARRRAPLWI